MNPAIKESAFIDLLVTKLQLGNDNREAGASRKLEGSWKLSSERLPSSSLVTRRNDIRNCTKKSPLS
jgi:hypothetical protein